MKDQTKQTIIKKLNFIIEAIESDRWARELTSDLVSEIEQNKI